MELTTEEKVTLLSLVHSEQESVIKSCTASSYYTTLQALSNKLDGARIPLTVMNLKTPKRSNLIQLYRWYWSTTYAKDEATQAQRAKAYRYLDMYMQIDALQINWIL